MPDAAQFLSGFGLIQGTIFGIESNRNERNTKGFILSSATSTHETVRRYQEYKYSITLTFTNLGSGNYENLFHDVMTIISKQPIIYGIRNPYHCIIDTPEYGDIVGDNKIITFHLIGHSYRT
jgi:hypothetical protein